MHQRLQSRWLIHRIIRKQRRRRRWTPIPEVPLLIYGDFEWDESEEGWADGLTDWVFLHGNLPAALFEIWMAKASNGFQYELAGTTPSTSASSFEYNQWGYRHSMATDVPDTLRYKVRYRNGADLRPFSIERDIVVTA